MIPTLLATAVTCVASVMLGQAALRLAGARGWSWLAPSVGISVLMLLALPATHLPGRCATTAAIATALTVAAGVWCLRDPAHRPPLSGLLAALPVAGLTLVPFLAAGHWGTLGTSLNNDMAPHLTIAEAYLSHAPASVISVPADYPVGPHAVVAMLAKGLGARVDEAFAGFTMALPIIGAWTALALVRRASWAGQVVVATVVGMPFLIAAYYGEAAFKEVLQADLVLAVALLLAGYGPALGRGRLVPLALLTGGIVLVYSLTGLPWPVAFVGLFVAGEAVLLLRRHGLHGTTRKLRAHRAELAVGALVVLAVFVPQLPRVADYVAQRGGVNGTGIEKTNLGNLVGPLPGWEAFGVWSSPDFRMPAPSTLLAGASTALVVALVLFGVAWALRRGHWMLPLAAGAALLIWAVSTSSQSPYVSAKALVIASPLLMALAVAPLVEREARSSAWRYVAPLLALALLLRVGVDDVRALRVSPVGPTDHMLELRSLRPLLDDRSALFLGNDDFIAWELAGHPVTGLVIEGASALPLRAEKPYAYGIPLDVDSVDATQLNRFTWVIAPRDPAGSELPSQLRLVRATRSYALYRRVGRVAPRQVLGEGAAPGAVLRCDTPAGRALVRRGGIAAVRTPPVVVEAPAIAPGSSAPVALPLRPGAWELGSEYTSVRPVRVSAPGLRTTLPANLDRLGSRWPIGRLVVHGTQPVTLTFATDKTPLTPRSATAALSNVVATRIEPPRIVPLRAACGRYVDWYRSAAPPRAARPDGG
jgi:hypothetical protein